jgi:hypothetical protein
MHAIRRVKSAHIKKQTCGNLDSLAAEVVQRIAALKR